jgi:hypothetical protein
MTRPNFFIIGAPKCGTTAMTRYLECHPDVFLAERKDLHFFGSDLGFSDREWRDESAYLAHFDGADQEKRVGESSVWYLYSKQAATEIHAFTPQARVIAMVRNPVDAMYALYSQLRFNSLGDEDIEDFESALAAEPDRADGRRIPPGTPLPEALLYRRVVAFTEQVRRYHTALGPNRVHVVLQNEMSRDTAGTYRKVLEFLDVDPDHPIDPTPVNTAKAVRSEQVRRLIGATPSGLKNALPGGLRQQLRKTIRRLNSKHTRRPPLDPALRARLLSEFEPQVQALGELLQRDLSQWNQ